MVSKVRRPAPGNKVSKKLKKPRSPVKKNGPISEGSHLLSPALTPTDERLMARLVERQHMFTQFGEMLGELQARDQGLESVRSENRNQVESEEAYMKTEAEKSQESQERIQSLQNEIVQRNQEVQKYQSHALELSSQKDTLGTALEKRTKENHVLKNQLDANEARRVASQAIDTEEVSRLRRAVEELNSALATARNAAEAARREHIRANDALRQELTNTTQSFQRELQTQREAMQAAVAKSERLGQQSDLAQQALTELQTKTKGIQSTHLDQVKHWAKEADRELDARAAADAATCAALAQSKKSTKALQNIHDDFEVSMLKAKEKIATVIKERKIALTALREAEARWRGVAVRERDMAIQIEAANAEVAAQKAMYESARGDLAAASEAKLIADEERDAAQAVLKDIETQLNDKFCTRIATLEKQCTESKQRAREAELSSNRGGIQFQKLSDAHTAALAATNAMSSLHAQAVADNDKKHRNHCKQLEALSEKLETELSVRLDELTSTKEALINTKKAHASAIANRAEEKKAADLAASERELRSDAERKRLLLLFETAQKETQAAINAKSEYTTKIDTLRANAAALEARILIVQNEKDQKEKDMVASENECQRLLRELEQAQARQIASDEALAAQHSAANDSLIESRAAIEKLRSELKHATRVGAEGVTHFQQAAAFIEDKFVASEAVADAMKMQILQSEGIARDRQQDIDAAVEAALEAEALLKQGRYTVWLSDRAACAEVVAARAAGIASQHSARCDAIAAQMIASKKYFDAEQIAERATQSASAARADMAAAIAEARLDREAAAEQTVRAREAHAAANDALRSTAAELAKEKQYSSRLEKEGFDELIELRREASQFRQRLESAEASAQTATNDLQATRQKMRETQAETAATMSTLGSRLRTAERLVETERERRLSEQKFLKNQAEQAEVDARQAIEKSREATAALRAELEQQRAAVYSARSQSADIEHKLDEALLARDALQAQVDELRQSLQETESRASRAAQAEIASRRELDRNHRTPSTFQPVAAPTTDLEQLRRRLRGNASEDEQKQHPYSALQSHTTNISQQPSQVEHHHHQQYIAPQQHIMNTHQQHSRIEDPADEEIRRHLALAAAARAGGLLPTPRDDEDYAQPQVVPQSEAERRLQSLEESAFTEQHQDPDSTTQTIAAAARYLERRRQRDHHRASPTTLKREFEDQPQEPATGTDHEVDQRPRPSMRHSNNHRTDSPSNTRPTHSPINRPISTTNPYIPAPDTLPHASRSAGKTLPKIGAKRRRGSSKVSNSNFAAPLSHHSR